jgi:hypothetical protein
MLLMLVADVHKKRKKKRSKEELEGISLICVLKVSRLVVVFVHMGMGKIVGLRFEVRGKGTGH